MPGTTLPSIDTLILLLVRIFAYLGFGIYIVFATIVLRQVQTMRKTVETTFSGFALVLGIVHFVVAIGALLFVVSYLQ